MNTIFACMIALLFAVNPVTVSQARADSGPDLTVVELAAMQGALDARDGLVQSLEKKDFSKVAHDAFEHALLLLVDDLRARGDDQMANDLIAQWQRTQSAFFLSVMDLGDHSPLFPWLADFFTKMADKYGTIILSLPYVKDLITMNFAIPVVFNPHGKWQVVGVDSRIEYRKHFIPFVNIVTYYVSLYGCKYIMAKQGMAQIGNQLCGKAAEKLEFAMGRYIAPQISDWIFHAGQQPSPHFDASSYRYTSAEDLQRAIQH